MRALLLAVVILAGVGCQHEPVGTILTYEVAPELKAHGQGGDMKRLVAAVDRRVNGGSALAEVRDAGNGQIEVGIFGHDAKTQQRIERLLKRPGTLEFRILANDRDHKSIIDRATKADRDQLKDAEEKLLAWWVPAASGQEQVLQQDPALVKRVKTKDDQKVLEILVVKDPFDLTEMYLVRAEVGDDARGHSSIRLTFNRRGGQLMSALSGQNLPDTASGFARQMGIILDGRLAAAPRLHSAIGERAEITGNFTKEEAEDLLRILDSGVLPCRIVKVDQRTPNAR
jgi:preprotein translocase subunit SecD